MIHRKARSLMSAPEAIATVAAAALSQAASQQTGPTGSISVPNSDGTRTVLGAQNVTGSTMATHVGDTTPPGVPTGITAWSGDGTVHVAWDGTLTGGIPADFDHVTLLANGTAFAALTSAGSATCKAVTVGATVSVTATSEDDVCAIDGTPAHNVSAACTAVSVVVTDTAAATDQHFWSDTDGAHVSSTGDHDLSGANLLLTSAKLAFRSALVELFSIVVSSTSAVISMLGGKFRLAYEKLYSTDTTNTATVSSDGDLALSSTTSAILDYHHTVTAGEAAEDTTLVPSGTVLHADVVTEHYDDLGGAYAEMRAESTSGTKTHAALIMLRSGCTSKTGAENGSNMDITADTLTKDSGRILADTVLYNGGAALSYDTAPGAGTTGTVPLSEDFSHFKELVVQYSHDTGAIAENNPMFVSIVPAAEWVCLFKIFWQWNEGVPASAIQFAGAHYHLSGNTMTPDHSPYINFYNNSTYNYFDVEHTGGFAIRRVTGRR